MFASPSALLQTPVIAPLFLPYRTSKRVRNPELSAELRSSQNTLRWFSQSRLCSALLAYRAEVERALSYTPVFREELTVRNSCAWPATFDSKHVAILGCTSSKTPISGIARGGVISRGFRTKASFARSAYGDADPLKAEDFLRQIDGKKTQPSETKSDRLHAMFQDKNLSAEEQMRLRVAFAEGYRLGPRRKGIQERLGLIGISLVMFYIMFRLVGKVVFKGANEIAPEDVDVKFEDVIGVEEAKQELLEIVDFLKNPKKYSNLGGRLPKGALLVGPPGTGKTLLARAVAGEAGVPFFHASGSEFDEVLVGQGARRMRDLFNNAKERAPCVIFIDEIDSVGAKRSTSTLHPYANQTINQLLSEMDGFRQNEGVIVLGATNRRDDLDKALLRPGRFDVEVQVPKPDVTGRKNLFDYYMSKVKADQSIDLDYLARGTTGFTGADIESMVNQAALKAAIDEQEFVTMEYLLQARDKILMGPEIRSRVPLHEDKVITAYHEGGHALVAYYSKDATPIHKVTIMPRGQSLGHTSFIPSKDEIHRNKSQILATIDMAMAGRAAEELMFGSEKVTTGAYSDFQQATQLATAMVKYWGMSDKVGERVFASKQNSLVTVNDVSDQTSELIDEEIKRTLHESMERAKNILRTHERELKLLADALLKYETLDAKEVKQLLETGSLER